MYGQPKGGGILGLVAFLGIVFVAFPIVSGKPSPLLEKLNLPSISSLTKMPSASETVGVVPAVQQVAPVISTVADVYTDHAQYAAGTNQEESVQQELIRIPEDQTDNPYTDSKNYSSSNKINGY